MRVLLVEDDEMIAQGLQTALRQAAFAVDWMRDGKSAGTALQTANFDLVLLDLGLPHRDGIDRQSAGCSGSYSGIGSRAAGAATQFEWRRAR